MRMRRIAWLHGADVVTQGDLPALTGGAHLAAHHQPFGGNLGVIRMVGIRQCTDVAGFADF